MGTERRAAIDIGTVTARLLVADVTDGVVDEIARRSVITHLGEDLTTSGRLSEAALSRTTAVVSRFAEEALSLGAEQILAVATSAARDAANGADLVRRVETEGVALEIISGEREGRLTFLGATYGLTHERVLVVDVGGGSTELVMGSSRAEQGRCWADIELIRSVDVGSRRITEMFLASDPPTGREIDRAAGWIADELRTHFPFAGSRAAEMVAVAGAATSLAAIDMVLDPYDPTRVHGYRLVGPALIDIIERLCAMTLAERRLVAGLEPGRAGVIIGGALVLQSVMAQSGLTSTLVSEHDILYGMVLGLDETETPAR